MKYPDGSEYVGDFKDNMKSGLGKFTFADSSTYEGPWENDLKQGRGTFTLANGLKFTGNFEKGEHRAGTLHIPMVILEEKQNAMWGNNEAESEDATDTTMNTEADTMINTAADGENAQDTTMINTMGDGQNVPEGQTAPESQPQSGERFLEREIPVPYEEEEEEDEAEADE